MRLRKAVYKIARKATIKHESKIGIVRKFGKGYIEHEIKEVESDLDSEESRINIFEMQPSKK